MTHQSTFKNRVMHTMPGAYLEDSELVTIREDAMKHESRTAISRNRMLTGIELTVVMAGCPIMTLIVILWLVVMDLDDSLDIRTSKLSNAHLTVPGVNQQDDTLTPKEFLTRLTGTGPDLLQTHPATHIPCPIPAPIQIIIIFYENGVILDVIITRGTGITGAIYHPTYPRTDLKYRERELEHFVVARYTYSDSRTGCVKNVGTITSFSVKDDNVRIYEQFPWIYKQGITYQVTSPRFSEYKNSERDTDSIPVEAALKSYCTLSSDWLDAVQHRCERGSKEVNDGISIDFINVCLVDIVVANFEHVAFNTGIVCVGHPDKNCLESTKRASVLTSDVSLIQLDDSSLSLMNHHHSKLGVPIRKVRQMLSSAQIQVGALLDKYFGSHADDYRWTTMLEERMNHSETFIHTIPPAVFATDSNTSTNSKLPLEHAN